MDFPCIKLHKNHRPINPKLCLNKQIDYNFYISLLNYLYNQIDMGFNPKYLITLHYQNSADYCRPIRETNNTLGFRDRYGFKASTPIWNSVAWDKFVDSCRNDIDLTMKNASQIRNLILKLVYGVKRLNRPDKYRIPNLYFFHEKGKVKLQFHTHILLPECDFSTEELHDLFNTSILERCKCIARWKKIDVTDVNKNEVYDVMGYLNKETNSKHIPLDPWNSNPIISN